MEIVEIVTILTQLISNLGFPIFVACALGWYIYKIEGQQTEVLTKLTNAVNELLDKLKG